MKQKDDKKQLAHSGLDRRRFLKSAGIAATGTGVMAFHPEAISQHFSDYVSLFENPFTLGVASGDCRSRSVIIWTRLAPDPLNGGGMPDEDVVVKWIVAKDPDFQHIVRKGYTIASKERGHSVHVNVGGLKPDHWYYYRFIIASYESRIGRTRTLPKKNKEIDKLSFAFVSCQEYQFGYYTAYKHLANEEIDFVIHLGDYIYEVGFNNPYLPSVRHHTDEECVTLEQYRNRYAVYQMDEHLQAARAAFPFFHVWDDHEIDNDWATDTPEDWDEQTKAAFVERRISGSKAFYENLPLRNVFVFEDDDDEDDEEEEGSRLYRRIDFGKLARISLLDCRRNRSDQPCTTGGPQGSEAPKANPPCPEDCPERFDENLMMLGESQEKWLLKNLYKSKSNWNVIASSVWLSQFVYDKRDPRTGAVLTDSDGKTIKLINTDCWDGYPVQRQRILDFIEEKSISNFVVVSGDWHVNGAMDIKQNFQQPDSATLGAEFGGVSISSIGPWAPIMQADMDKPGNEHVHYVEGDNLRAGKDVHGYVICHVNPDEWRTEFRVVDSVRKWDDGQISTDATFEVYDGVPGTTSI
jgi:alkaline phosphatase D